jgi:hypothetical protein
MKGSQFLLNPFQDSVKNSLKPNQPKASFPKNFHLDGFLTNFLKLTTTKEADKVFSGNQGRKSFKKLNKNADKAQKSMKLRIIC